MSIPTFLPAASPDCHCCQEFGQEGQCQSSCQKCRPGHYQPNNSSISCLKCPIGHNSSTFGNLECSACKPGFFANTTGMAVCLPCLPVAAGCAACLALVIGGTLSVYCKKRRIPKEKSSSTETHRLLDTEEKSEEPVYQGL
ncbi:PREDICTED: sushi, von Willebrand factor type A, EGF and pentraxin domain-containing protein 1-like [Branchiostoma belcheri]|uniref:Sushi, von Willebrand factor type A, EGF and pentraxin domain-containing protein 1-like n=1 Tax=Branchiostoma belcheri TaxID=7741 RepID=A0A6P4XY97_BRABE|nr:PREDICTED: sushi, von Willebrand factor type A, EGF and pentraxin domain-containing protein 1-like [Branchiostoma belcheri]